MALVTRYMPVPEFYAGKSVFLTGGSGYLGKVLMEKLLYSCPRLDKIYVLLREKKSVNAEQRMKNIIDQPLFSRIKAERPEDLEKLVVIRGELTAPGLNMSPEDLQTVKNNVSIVIHSAATVKFNEPLKVAMTINLEGTKNVLSLCKKLKTVNAFVYVSTAYSNSNRKVIEEVMYPPPASIDEAYELAEKGLGDNEITNFLNGLPNTYAYTKALAENFVSDNHGDVPTIIVRPSIVTGAKAEPLPGWVDNWFGPTGLVLPLALGICRTAYTEYDYNLDFIPVDYVCNLILVAATKAERSYEVAVYNSCTGYANPITIGEAITRCTNISIRDGYNILPFPQLVLYTKRKWLIKFIAILMHFLAYLADIVLQVVRKRPRLEKILSQSIMVQEALAFFTSQSWLIKSPRALALSKSLSPDDYQRFPCNPQDIVWEEYIPVYFYGVQKYLIKQGK